MWSRHIFHHYYYKVCSLHDFEFHFRQAIKMGNYSRTHLLQSISVAAWTDFHFLRKLNSCSLKFPGLWFVYASPMSKSFGANGSKSDISSLIEVQRFIKKGFHLPFLSDPLPRCLELGTWKHKTLKVHKDTTQRMFWRCSSNFSSELILILTVGLICSRLCLS